MHASCMKSALFMETKSGVDVLVLLLCGHLRGENHSTKPEKMSWKEEKVVYN